MTMLTPSVGVSRSTRVEWA